MLPATGSAQAGTLQNGVTKEIQVINNTGSEDAYVRVHIAIPNILDKMCIRDSPVSVIIFEKKLFYKKNDHPGAAPAGLARQSIIPSKIT